MAGGLITGVRSVALGVVDVGAQERFWTETWALTRVASEGGSSYLRGTGADHHIVSLHPRAAAELIAVEMNAANRAAVDQAARRVAEHGGRVESAPTAIATPGGGYGMTFIDPEGRRIRVIADSARHADAKAVADRPERLAHLVFNCRDADAMAKFWVDALDFKLSDTTRMMNFVRCNSDHHSIALVYAKEATLHHIAFQMPNLESVMRGAGRLKDAGFPIEWGIGRHGPGNNVFAYFVGPGGFPIEYTGEVEVVDDSYVYHGPEYWKWPPGRIDQWGIGNPPSERLEEAQHHIRFAARAEG